MRSGDLFLEASSAKQATALMKLRKLAHLDVTVAPHSTLNFSRGAYHDKAGWTGAEHKAPHPDLLIRLTFHRQLKWPTSDAQSDHTSRIRCDAFSARDLDILKTVCRGQPTCSRCAETPCQPFKALSLYIHRLISSHPILVDITYALANHLKKKDIRFCWISGHAGITGNELADTAVRSAAGSSERLLIPHSDLKACFRLKLLRVAF
ncbi:hypothetical protein TNCV_2009651 [Trichonephila clavipes]|nr:hypothetical protein TNCV_2009651 [Trichonephila clavipes]